MLAAVLLALPLIIFGGSYYIHPFPLPPANGHLGILLLQMMRDGGLSYAVTFSHILAGVFLIVPRTRFLAALLQLPMTIGIVAFHATMWREGLPIALVMLLLNLIILFEPDRLRSLVQSKPSP